MTVLSRSNCDNAQIEAYLNNNLDEEEYLDFLLHLDECQSCRDSLYETIRGTHDHYYRKKSGKRLEKELREISKIEKEESQDDDEDELNVA